jgi:hypothetical protein
VCCIQAWTQDQSRKVLAMCTSITFRINYLDCIHRPVYRKNISFLKMGLFSSSGAKFGQSVLSWVRQMELKSIDFFFFGGGGKTCMKANMQCRGHILPPLWSSGQSSWLQIQKSGFDCLRCQIFCHVVCGCGTGSTQLRDYN